MGGDIGKAIGGVTDAVGLTNYSGQEALDAQKKYADQANQLQREMYYQQRSDLNPFVDAGKQNLSSLVDGSFMNNWEQDPGYQFRMQEGMKAINNSAAARGMGNSGATLKALTRYGQDYASNEYNNAYNRKYTRLSDLARMGQNSAAGQATAAGSYGQNVGANLTGLGNAQASNIIGQTNRMSNFIQGGMEAGAKAMASDVRVKENISEVSKDEIKELKQNIKAMKFNYKDESYGEGEFVGVMAQDLEKSKLGKLLVFEDSNGVKKIDTNKAICLLLALMAE